MKLIKIMMRRDYATNAKGERGEAVSKPEFRWVNPDSVDVVREDEHGGCIVETRHGGFRADESGEVVAAQLNDKA